MKSLTIIDLGYGLMSNKSGGSTRLIEVMRRLDRRSFSLEFITTSGGRTLFQSEGLTDTITTLPSSFLFRRETHKFMRLISNLISLSVFVFRVKRFQPSDIVYSSSDYIFDVLPAALMKRRGSHRYLAFVHHLCAHPGKRKGSFLINMISYLGQRLSFRLIEKHADAIFVYDTPEGEEIAQLFSDADRRVHAVNNGINLELFDGIERQRMKWDACFAGGLRETKGIFDAIRIWKKVTATIPDARLVMMGSGSADTVKALERMISAHALDDNITLFGHATPQQLAQNMKDSNVFLSTSHEEGWGISLCEGLACGLRCVVYDLPAFKKMKPFITAVPKFDEETISAKLVDAIHAGRSTSKPPQLSSEQQVFLNSISWKIIASEEERIFNDQVSFT